MDAIDVLRKHNQWRRGELNVMPHSPREIGEAIDAACARIAQLEAELAEAQEKVRLLSDVEVTARAYFDRYLQDEADDVEVCTCGLEQHARAMELRAALAASKEGE